MLNLKKVLPVFFARTRIHANSSSHDRNLRFPPSLPEKELCRDGLDDGWDDAEPV